MKTAALVFATLTAAFFLATLLVADPWHRAATLTMAAVLVPFAALAGLGWAITPRSPVGAGEPPAPAPTGLHQEQP